MRLGTGGERESAGKIGRIILENQTRKLNLAYRKAGLFNGLAKNAGKTESLSTNSLAPAGKTTPAPFRPSFGGRG